MAARADAWWAELRTALAERPGELAFRAVASILDTWPGEDGNEALEFASERLQSWPDAVRVASWTWCCAAANGALPASLHLARTVRNSSLQCGCEPIPLTEFRDHPFLRSITSLESGPLAEEPSLGPLIEEPGRWPALRHLAAETSGEDYQALQRLLQSSLINQLETLSVDLERLAKRDWDHLALMGNQLTHLALSSGLSDRLTNLIKSSRLPELRALTLSCHGHDVDSSEAVRALTRLPALSRLKRLELADRFSGHVLASLFEAMDWPLEALTIKGHAYIDYFEIQNDCWLTPTEMRSLLRSPSLAALSELHIENERVGDGIVDVVAACTAGGLRRLALIDVALSDSGAVALSRLPQLAGVVHLDLSANLLGAAGIEAICRSPHLRGIQTLAIGGRFFNPYYDSKRSQPIGDEGLLAISRAPAFSAVQELEVSNAAIGPDGVRALARSGLAEHLRRLDLSTNAVGPAGASALAGACWPMLRELRLRRCDLDDDSIGAIARGDFARLGDLDLSYNSVGPSGAATLSACAGLANLWRLSLHDNFIGDVGLISLASSKHLTRLVELDLEQDCWNDRHAAFSDQAARAVARSSTFRRLDSLMAGCVGEHYVERVEDAFSQVGLAEITRSDSLRPAMRFGLRRSTVDFGEDDPEDEAIEPSKAEARETIQNVVKELSNLSGDAGEPGRVVAGLLTNLLTSSRDTSSGGPVQPAAPAPPDDRDRIPRSNDFRSRPKTQ